MTRDSLLEIQQLTEVLKTSRRSILIVLVEAEDAFAGPACSRAETLASIQWRLMRELRSYQLMKHAELFDRACRGKSERHVRLAAEMKNRCILLGLAYTEHLKKWSGRSGADTRPHFEAEARSLFGQIKNHLARESIETEALLNISGRSSI